jgi:hypothetical protein
MMKTNRGRSALILLIFLAMLFMAATSAGIARADRLGQVPTGSVPTVTGTPVDAYVVVRTNDQGFANLRAGPSAVDYEIVGMLIPGQQAPALGRSPGGDWIEVAYPGVPGGVAWIWVDLVDVVGKPPIVEAPPTPTPRMTATIDPTLAAQFLTDLQPTRLPTFTAPPPLSIPTFAPDAPIATSGRVPIGFVIIGMAVVGMFGVLVSLLRGR